MRDTRLYCALVDRYATLTFESSDAKNGVPTPSTGCKLEARMKSKTQRSGKGGQADLFSVQSKNQREPLAERMRPHTFAQFAGQEHLIGDGGLLRRAVEADRLGSIILHWPPGTG